MRFGCLLDQTEWSGSALLTLHYTVYLLDFMCNTMTSNHAVYLRFYTGRKNGCASVVKI